MSIKEEILESLNAKESNKYTCQMFLLGVPCYEFKLGEIEGLFCECDFNTGEDLRKKDLVGFRIKKGDKISIFHVSKCMFNMIGYVKRLIKQQIE